MRLTERIHLVGSGEPDLATSDPIDSQVYLVDTGDGLLCIDAGAGRSVERILAEVRAGGLVPDEIRWVLLTHGHADHAGGAAAWRRRLPDVRIGASVSVAGWIEAADEEATSVDRARRAGIYPPDYRLEPCEIDVVLEPGTTLELGAIRLEIVPTEGHAAGHVAFLGEIDGVLTAFSGDALFPGGRILLQDTWDCDVRAALRSVERLAGRDPGRLLAGHLAPVLDGVREQLDLALARIALLAVPESIS
ncbi:MAG: hydroxyacylglutathione hydrolase [Chloroflexota bacterium]|nr:hydroxyacylglutathione hydrolase [Chloroflexota bacterium]